VGGPVAADGREAAEETAFEVLDLVLGEIAHQFLPSLSSFLAGLRDWEPTITAQATTCMTSAKQALW
jgi:hypothetical protein